jgi:hypothetical protein
VEINRPRSYLAWETLYLSRGAVSPRPSVGLTFSSSFSLSLGLGRALHLLPVTLARHVDFVAGLVEGVHAAQVAAILGQLPGGAAYPFLVLLPGHTKKKKVFCNIGTYVSSCVLKLRRSMYGAHTKKKKVP